MKTLVHFLILSLLVGAGSCGKDSYDGKAISGDNSKPKTKIEVEIPKEEDEEEPATDVVEAEPPIQFVVAGTVSLKESDYIPNTKVHIYDSSYMSRVSDLIDYFAKQKLSKDMFARAVKTVAWIESRWEHYSLDSNGKTLVLLGDSNNSYGMFQIHQKWHGKRPLLIDNVRYAVNALAKIFKSALTKKCKAGTNKGTSKEAFLRRIYAGYNDGMDDFCREGDYRDARFVNFYRDQPWLTYIDNSQRS
jgi:hypothetical protein